MAKWAKSQNAKQEALADMKRAQHGNVKESASADAGFAMLERKVSTRSLAVHDIEDAVVDKQRTNNGVISL